MKFVSYNIQYSRGKDGVYNLNRIADAVRRADIIGLQEVTRNFPQVPDVDQPASLGQLLPEYFWTYGAAVDIDAGSALVGGRAISKRLQFGTMLLSRWPILSKRLLLLPRVKTFCKHDIQNVALEAIIDTPGGAVRVYVTHLNHLSSATRQLQLEWLVPKLFAVVNEGASVSGGEWQQMRETPVPVGFVVLGDFNMQPDSAEYLTAVGMPDYYHGKLITSNHWVDSWQQVGHTEENNITWYDEAQNFKTGLRLDYGFVSPELAGKVAAAWIDHHCDASDHQPYWLELDF